MRGLEAYFLSALLALECAPRFAFTQLEPREPYNIFVDSINGDDGTSGAESAPLRSLEGARSEIRTRNRRMQQDIVVHLAPGVHTLTKPYALTEDDSGFGGHSVIYVANQDAIISGGAGIPAAAWSHYEKGIYTAHIGAADFKQIYESGKRANRSRFWLPKRADGNAWPVDGYHYSHNDNPLKGFLIAGMDIVGMKSWMDYRCKVTNLTAEKIGLSQACNDALNGDSTATMATAYPVWAENNYQFIHDPGDWYYSADTGDLFYRPFDPTSLTQNNSIVYPVVSSLITANGAHNIAFQGINFQYTNFAPETYFSGQGGRVFTEAGQMTAPPSAIEINRSSDMIIAGNMFRNLGGSGVSIQNASANILVSKNSFVNIAGEALHVGGDYPTNIPRSNVVSDNLITAIGLDYYDREAINGGFTTGLQILFNSIIHVPYSGISLGSCLEGCSTHQATAQGNNNVEGNYISHFGEILTDTGGIYTAGRQDGTYIQNNCIQNMHAGLPGIHRYTHAAGIYLDSGSFNIAVINNEIGLGLLGPDIHVKHIVNAKVFEQKLLYAPAGNIYRDRNDSNNGIICGVSGPRQE